MHQEGKNQINDREVSNFWRTYLQFEVNNRNVEIIDDALGGFNIANCDSDCKLDIDKSFSSQPKATQNFSLVSQGETSNNNNHVGAITNKEKYSLDVVDDLSGFTNSNFISEKEENDEFHNRIVRVSLQKDGRRNQGFCFNGNDSYALYETDKFIDAEDRYQNDVNIRFKTNKSNGLMFLIYQKFSDDIEDFFSLSVENG